ncbi:MAG: hypothetical protein M1298_05645 [Chloroflexi bacterium]|nr:hypothetical protein [Chloroflexota bacterium]
MQDPLVCSYSRYVDRSRPLYVNTGEYRYPPEPAGPFFRILVTSDHPADIVLWEDLRTLEVQVFTRSPDRPCVFLGLGNDLRALGRGVLDDPVLIAVREGKEPYIAPLATVGTIEWQLV